MPSEISLRRVAPADRGWVRNVVSHYFGTPQVVSRGRLHRCDEQPGFVAEWGGERAALLVFEVRGADFEVVVLASKLPRRGLATALLEAGKREARDRGCRRLWLVTTNDNTAALGFYQSRGLQQRAVHRGAVEEARRLKPSIPETGLLGVPIRDEIELELIL
jgi:GNAT superfamily N-acetyltransferase